MKKKKEKRKRTTDPALCQLLIWDVPRTLRAKFKANCAKNGMTMRAAVLVFLQKYHD